MRSVWHSPTPCKHTAPVPGPAPGNSTSIVLPAGPCPLLLFFFELIRCRSTGTLPLASLLWAQFTRGVWASGQIRPGWGIWANGQIRPGCQWVFWVLRLLWPLAESSVERQLLLTDVCRLHCNACCLQPASACGIEEQQQQLPGGRLRKERIECPCGFASPALEDEGELGRGLGASAWWDLTRAPLRRRACPHNSAACNAICHDVSWTWCAHWTGWARLGQQGQLVCWQEKMLAQAPRCVCAGLADSNRGAATCCPSGSKHVASSAHAHLPTPTNSTGG